MLISLRKCLDLILEAIVENAVQIEMAKHASDVKDAYEKGRADGIDEFAKAMKRKYPLMENDFGMTFNDGIHKNIEETAEQLKEKADE